MRAAAQKVHPLYAPRRCSQTLAHLPATPPKTLLAMSGLTRPQALRSARAAGFVIPKVRKHTLRTGAARVEEAFCVARAASMQ